MFKGLLKGNFIGHLVASLSLLVVLFSIMPDQFFSKSALNFTYHNMTLHSTLEALACFSFFLLGALLYLKAPSQEHNTNIALSLSFMSMGILLGFHASFPVGNSFIITKSFANLIGSFWLLVLLFHKLNLIVVKKRELIAIITVISVFLWGLFVSLNSYLLPPGIEEGNYSRFSLVLNNISAYLFLIVSIRLFLYYKKYKHNKYLIFTFLTSLLSGSSFIFNYSWEGSHVWWIMHIFTTAASLIAFGLLFTEFSILIKNYSSSIEQLEKANEEFRAGKNNSIYSFQNSSDTIIIFNSNKIFDCNKSGLELFEISEKENLESVEIELLSNDVAIRGERFKLYKLLKEMISDNNFEEEFKFSRKDGNVVLATLSISLMEFDRERKYQAVIQDITNSTTQSRFLRLEKKIIEGLSSFEEMREASDFIITNLCSVDGIDAVSYYEYDPVDKVLNLCSSINLPKNYVNAYSRYTKDSLHTYLAIEGKPVFTNHSKINAQSSVFIDEISLQAFAIIPIVYDEELLGVLHITSFEIEDFSEELRNFIETTALGIGSSLWRIQAEQLLNEKSEELNRFFSLALDLLCIADINGYFKRLNSAWESTLGYKISELIGKKFLDFVHPDDLELTLKTIAELSEDKPILNFVNRYRHKDGSYKWIEWRSFPYLGKYIYAAARDITETKKITDELKADEERLESLFRISQYKSNNIQELLDYALHEAITLTKSKIGYIYKYDEETKVFTLNSWSKDVMKECAIREPQTCYELDKTGIWGEAVRQRKAITMNDYDAANKLKKGYPEGHIHLKKYLTIPVIKNDVIVAVVGVANKVEDYTNSDIRHLNLFMDSVWSIVTKIHSESEIKDYLELNEKLIFSSTLGILAYNASGDCVIANQAAADGIGTTIENLKKQNFLELKSWVISGLLDEAKKVLATKETKKININTSSTFGKEIWWECVLSYFENKGEPHLLLTFHDVSQNKLAAEALSASEEKYRLLFENMNAGFALHELIYDENGKPIDYRYLEINPGFEKLTGVSINTLLGKTVKEIMPKTENYWIEIAHKVASTGEPLYYENYSTELGKYYNTFYFSPKKNQFAVVFYDITDKKIAEEKHLTSETRFRKLFENSPEPILFLKDGKFTDCNSATLKLLKYNSKDEIVDFSPLGLSPEYQPDGNRSDTKATAMIKIAYEMGSNLFEWEHIKADGSQFLVEVLLTPIYPLEENTLHVVWRDITDRKIAEFALKFEKERIKNILNTANAVIINLDEHGFVTGINEFGCRLIGYEENEIIGKNWFTTVLPDNDSIEQVYDNFKKIIKGEVEAQKYYENDISDREGNIIKIAWQNTYDRDAVGNIVGILSVGIDITARAKALQKIKEMNDELKSIIDIKDRFFSIVAHDLKSPMQGLIGFSQILKEELDTISIEEGKEILKSIFEISKELNSLLDNLLNWSRLQTGRMEFNPEELNLYTTVHPIIRLLSEVASLKEISIKMKIDPSLMIRADENMIQLILRNLIANAIKFSYFHSEIIVEARAGDFSIEISVQDFGMGIDKKLKDDLFRTDKKTTTVGTNNEKGTGLGLLLCKEMVNLHHGEITVESEFGKGSKFSVKLPR